MWDSSILRGENAGRAKLSNKQVVEIRQRYKAEQTSYAKLAKEYGVSTGSIQAIIKRQTYRFAEKELKDNA